MRRLLVLLIVMLVAVPAGAQTPVSAATAPGIEGRITADGRSLSGATVQAIQSGAVIAADTTDAGSWLSAAIVLILLGWIGRQLARRPRRHA